jgi:adhesin transport system membrane fusion protein
VSQTPSNSLFSAVEAYESLKDEEIVYANEVDAALARKPRIGARALSLCIGFMFVVFTCWAAWASLDEVTHAEGQVIAAQRTQTIQNLEGGILQEIMVSEGQIVEKDAALARLDNEVAASTYRDAMNKSLEHMAAICRLEAELAHTAPEFPPNLGKDLETLVGKKMDTITRDYAAQLIKDQMEVYRVRMDQHEAELDLLRSQFEQREREVQEQLARKNQLDHSLAIAQEKRNIAYPLLQRKVYSRVDFLNLEQTVVSLMGDVEQLAAVIPKTQAAATEARQRIVFRQAELDTATLDELNKRRGELTSLRETLAAGSDRVTRTVMRSPVKGTIRKIYINTIGGVVKPGDPIMDIVPLDDTLLIEARVRPADVAFLHPGQPAMVKVSAYDFSIYGGLDATMENISADTIEDKRGDFFYLAKLRTERTSLLYRGDELPIIPGMMVTADILTGKKTVLDYIVKPILKAKQDALRER